MLNQAAGLDRAFHALAAPDRRAFLERHLDRLGGYLAETASPSDTGPATETSWEPAQQEENR